MELDRADQGLQIYNNNFSSWVLSIHVLVIVLFSLSVSQKNPIFKRDG